jgi:aryl sulfotransferase
MPVMSERRIYRTWMVDSRRWDGYRPRPGDVIVATYPKCGTTWVQQIVTLLIFQTPEPRPISDIAPWIDRRLGGPPEALFATLDAQTHRRSLKTHMPFDGLPIHDDVKYIHVARDGRDACISYHNQITRFKPEVRAALDEVGLSDETLRRPYPTFPASAREYFRMWLSEGIGDTGDGTPFLSYFEFENTYWRERRRKNLLMVHYRDLKADLAGEMRRIAGFLDIAIADPIFPDLVQAASFEHMRRVGDQLMPRVMKTFEGGAERFFYKGENDRWRGVLSEDDLALYDRKMRASFSPACVAWLERGRAGTCDPRDAPD